MPKKKNASSNNTNFSTVDEFYSDISLKDMYYAQMIRPIQDKGIVRNFSPRSELPAEYNIYRASDVPGSNLIDTPCGKIPLLSTGSISYAGEPIGIIVGPDERTLNSLNEINFDTDGNEIHIYPAKNSSSEIYSTDFFDQPHLEGNTEEIKIISDALNLSDFSASPQNRLKEIKEMQEDDCFEELFTSVLAQKKIFSGPIFEGNKNEAEERARIFFDQSPNVVQNCWSYKVKAPYFLEPLGAICSYTEEITVIYSPTQWPDNLRNVVSTAMNIPKEKIFIKRTRNSNNGTNSIWYDSFVAAHACLASQKCGHPVKIVYSKDEQEKFIDAMQEITIVHKTAANEEGRITLMHIDIDVNTGAYNPFADEILNRLCISACGCYNPLNVLITAKAISSNTPPSSLDFEQIDSAAFFAVENQISLLCHKYSGKYSPLEIRQKNLSSSSNGYGSLPFKFDFTNKETTLQQANKVSSFERRYLSYFMSNGKSFANKSLVEKLNLELPRRGIGFACAFEGSGYLGSNLYDSSNLSISVTKEEDGSITIHSAPVSQNVLDIWKQQVLEILETKNVKIDSTFAQGKEPGHPESVYSNISVMTNLLAKCCDAIKRKGESAELPFTVTKRNSSSKNKIWNAETFTGQPYMNTSFMAATVEIDFDKATYRERIKEINIVVNGGKLFNSLAAKNTIRLAVQKILSSIMLEEIVECDNVNISFIKSDEEPSQIGELVFQVIPAAYTQAISQAIDCTVNFLPLKSDSIFNMLKEQEEIREVEKITNEIREELESTNADQTEFEQ